MSSFLVGSSLVAIAVVLLSINIKYPRLRMAPRVFLTRYQKNTFQHWKWYEYRHQKLQLKGKFTDKLFAKEYVESIYSDEMNISCAKLLFEGVPTVKDLKRLKASHKEFVIKANHGCGWNIIETKDNDLKEQDMMEYITKCSAWLKQTYHNNMITRIFNFAELQYKYIEPKVFIEECLGDELMDYKLHTFNGKVEFVQVQFDRAGYSCSTNVYWATPWRFIDGVWSYPLLPYNDPKTQIEEPPQFQTMVAFAEAFTKENKISYCRVDLYLIRNQVYFGEFTFSPGTNLNHWKPLWFDQHLFEIVAQK